MSEQNNQLAPEDQVKTLTISYPEFCLLLGALTSQIEDIQTVLWNFEHSTPSRGVNTVQSEQDKLVALKAFYVRLGGVV